MPTPLHFRPLQNADLDAISRIHYDAARIAYAHRRWDHSLAEVKAWYAGKLPDWDWGCVATIDGQAVGFAAATGSFLDQIFIVPAFQNQGIGRALIAEMIRDHPGAVTLHTDAGNARARAFYEHLGFVEIERFHDAGEDETFIVYRLGTPEPP